jgi:hypothetical protein
MWWNAVQTCVWIATRDDATAQRMHEKRSDYLMADADRRLALEATVYQWPTSDVGDALKQLNEHCTRGAPSVMGRERGLGDHVRIPDDAWVSVEIRDDESRGVIVAPRDRKNHAATWWDALQLRQDEVQSIWPTEASNADSCAAIYVSTEQPQQPGIELEVRADAWLRQDMIQRAKNDEDRRRPAMVIALRGEFPGLSKRAAEKLIEALDRQLRPKRGPKKGSRRVSTQK